jgi:hypothetical protein
LGIQFSSILSTCPNQRLSYDRFILCGAK